MLSITQRDQATKSTKLACRARLIGCQKSGWLSSQQTAYEMESISCSNSLVEDHRALTSVLLG